MFLPMSLKSYVLGGILIGLLFLKWLNAKHIVIGLVKASVIE